MRTVHFSKMHGAGNDYIYINCLKEAPRLSSEIISRWCKRHTGIGADGVVLILPSRTYDFRMRMFNADGSEAEMCGNAVRCVAKYLFERRLTEQKVIELETAAGLKILELHVQSGRVDSVRVDMGEPLLDPVRIPVDLPQENVIAEALPGFEPLRMTCVSMGNPHAVFLVDQITDDLVLGLGPRIEDHPLFPKKTNVEFVRVIDKHTIEMRVWERGTGETLCCGTGACAAAVACVLNRLTYKKLTLIARGGELQIEWAANNHVYKTGPAEFVFDGTIELEE
jgi:diaminopimelate epimerase